MARIMKIEAPRVAKNLPDASIPPGTTFTGDIETRGGVRVDGTVKGNVKAGGDITIGIEGVVEGNVNASNVNIAGKVIGDITATGAVQMLSGTKMVGGLTASSFAIENGAYYQGQCTISDNQEKPLLNAAVSETSEPEKVQEAKKEENEDSKLAKKDQAEKEDGKDSEPEKKPEPEKEESKAAESEQKPETDKSKASKTAKKPQSKRQFKKR